MSDLFKYLQKDEFIPFLSSFLKEAGYVRKRTYWFKESDDFFFCVHIQGSLWSNDDYYVNIGVSKGNANSCLNELNWYWWHRCSNNNKEINLTLDEIKGCIACLFGDYQQLSEKDFFEKYHSVRLNNRYIVL